MLEDSLKKMAQGVGDLRAVLLVDKDGMVVSAAGTGEDSPRDLMAASYMDIARRLSAANREAEMEPPEEVMTTGPFGSVLFRAVTRDYGLLALLGPDSILGQARFELRKVASGLLPELED